MTDSGVEGRSIHDAVTHSLGARQRLVASLTIPASGGEGPVEIRLSRAASKKDLKVVADALRSIPFLHEVKVAACGD